MSKLIAVVLGCVIGFAGCSQATGGDDQEAVIYLTLAHPVIDTEKPNLCLIGDSRVNLIPVDLFAKEFDVYNYGVGGTTSQYNAEIARLLSLSGEKFDYAIISVGVNDYAERIETDDSIENLKTAVGYMNEFSDRVFITTVPGVSLGSCITSKTIDGYKISNKAINNRICEVEATLIPLASELNGSDGEILRAEYDDGSGIHYNAAGYNALHDLYMQYLEGVSAKREAF